MSPATGISDVDVDALKDTIEAVAWEDHEGLGEEQYP